MAFILDDRVKETSTSTGVGDFVLNGAMLSYRTFDSACNIGDNMPYCIENGAEFEVGIGTYTALNTISRNAASVITSSSGPGVLVNFSAAIKIVFLTLPANTAYNNGGISYELRC